MTALPAFPARRLLTLRLAAGLTQQQAATQTHCSGNTWRRWESGSTAPHPSRVPVIASALGVPVAALYAPDGWKVVRELRLQPATVARVRALGRPEAERVAALLAAGLVDEVLAVCRQPRVKQGTRAKPRRTRAEVLAAIAASAARREQREAGADPTRPAGPGPGGGA